MTAPFKVGDVVVCVAHHPGLGPDMGARIGCVYRIADLCDLVQCPICGAEDGIEIVGHSHPDYAYCVNEFEIVEKATDEFTEQMRACRPVRESVPDLLSAEYRPWVERKTAELRDRLNGGQPA